MRATLVGLPIILVACKKDLRRDQVVLEGLKNMNQRPVTPEEVSYKDGKDEIRT